MAGIIFAAGQILSKVNANASKLKSDLNGVGSKMRDSQKQRHNLSLIVMAQTDDREERFKIAALLKED